MTEQEQIKQLTELVEAQRVELNRKAKDMCDLHAQYIDLMRTVQDINAILSVTIKKLP